MKLSRWMSYVVLSVMTICSVRGVELTRPTPQQMAFMDMEYGAFLCLCLNQYNGQEHGDGHSSPEIFNPAELDTDQWVRTVKSFGAKYAVLTARHEDGFCLWPTKTTDYSLANSPYKDGKGDIVRDFVNSCRKYGIKPCLYHTASHDAHHTHFRGDDVKWDKNLNTLISNNFKKRGKEGQEAYIAMQVEQMRELLTNYGDVYYLWCDHWNGQETTEDDMLYHQVTNEAFRKVTALMRELQPHCVMLGPDVETPGNESGRVVYPMWNCMDTVDGTHNSRGTGTKVNEAVPNKYGLLETSSKTGHPLGKFWRSRECTTNTGFHHGGWFWHPDHVKKTNARTLAEHMDMYYRGVGLGASAIINLPIDDRGLMPDDIVQAAENFGKELKARFGTPIAEINAVTKGDVVLSWNEPKEINTIVTRENIANGQRIAKYSLEAYVDGEWTPLKPVNKFKGYGPYPGVAGLETIGLKKIDRVQPVTTNMIRFKCVDSVAGDAELRSIAVYQCKPLNERSLEATVLAKPTQKQIDFADWEVGAFICYDLITFSGEEHGDGRASPERFNPTELDMDQWILAAKELGAKYAVLTCRHEGGFCLWPSKTTEYTIANSPYKDGKGDLVREFVDACRRHDMKVGFYHTCSHDANMHLSWYKGKIGWGASRDKIMEMADERPGMKERFKKLQVEQMRELLTNYGPVDFMWSDHWNALDPDGVWRAVTDLAVELQPNMVFMGPDTWIPGNETGHVVYPMWNAVKTVDGSNNSRPATVQSDVSVKNDYGLLETDVYTGHPLGDFWRVRECTTNRGFNHGGWFWHRHLMDVPTEFRLDLYYRTVGLGANTIINLPPNKKGLVDAKTVKAATAYRKELERRFDVPVAETKGVQSGNVVELQWEKPCLIDHIIIMENIKNGQKVAKYTYEALVDGQWQELKPRNTLLAPHYKPEVFNPDPGFETIGHKKIDRVNSVLTNRIRFRCLEAVVEPVEIRSMAVYNVYERVLGLKSDQPAWFGQLPYCAVFFDNRSCDFPGFNPRCSAGLGGKTYAHSVRMYPYKDGEPSSATLYLDVLPVKYKTFKATIGLSDRLKKGRGSADFRIELLDDGKWEQVFKSKIFKGGDAPEEIEIALNGAQGIRLSTTDAGDGRNSDHATWGSPRLVN